MVYFLLLDRKRRKPANEDDTEIVLRGSRDIQDPPKKRTDSARANRYAVGSIADGSPINPRKTYGRHSRSGRHSSLGGSPTESPRASARDLFSTNNGTYSARGAEDRGRSSTRSTNNYHYYTQPVDPQTLAEAARHVRAAREAERRESKEKQTPSRKESREESKEAVSVSRKESVKSVKNEPAYNNKMSESTISTNMGSTASSTNSLIAGNSQQSIGSNSGPWRSKLTNIKNSFLGTPRFHRRKTTNPTNGAESDNEDSQMIDTTDLVKKSWFGSLTSSMSVERDDTHCVPVQGKTLNAIKAELIRAFLTIHELSHSVIGQNCFRVEYKRGPTAGGSVFSRGIKMNVDIIASPQQIVVAGDIPTYVVQFSLLAGPVRRFKRLVEHLSAILQATSKQRPERVQQQQLMVRPRRLSDSSVSSACSDTESSVSINVLRANDRDRSELSADPYSQSPSMRSVGSTKSSNSSVKPTFKSPATQRRNTTIAMGYSTSGGYKENSNGGPTENGSQNRSPTNRGRNFSFTIVGKPDDV